MLLLALAFFVEYLDDLVSHEGVKDVVSGRDRVFFEEVRHVDRLLNHLEQHLSNRSFERSLVKVIFVEVLAALGHYAFDLLSNQVLKH